MPTDDRTRSLRAGAVADGDTLTFDGETPAPRAGELARGSAIGRYLVLDTLGRGGMGTVYKAYDPELDRRIAVKVLRAGGGDGTAGRVRMQREAQALARLPHPNVIAVHDVGAAPGGVFIAMELVEGGTLKRWQERRPWRDVLRAYVEAGRGLSAAHAAGLVHRDFKPENVLIDGAGRAKVTDFGLVRSVVAEPEPPAGEPPAPVRVDGVTSAPLSSELTEAGAVMGTPLYMSPEQLGGRGADERSDQFAWCVAAWEALYGAHPFDGDDTTALATSIAKGPPRPPPASPVPRAIGRALARGLEHTPSARWPSVDALLGQIERALRGRRRAWLAIGAGAAAAGAIAIALVATSHGSPAEDDPCADAARAIDPLWTADTRARIDRAFAATGSPYAADASAGADRAIGGWAGRWRAAATASCRDTRVARTQSEALLDLRTSCLDQRLARAQGLVDALGQADRDLVEAAVERLAAELPDLRACDDAAALTGRAPVPAGQDGAVGALERELDTLGADAMRASTADAARALAPRAARLVADARAIGWAPGVARALAAAGELDDRAGDGKAALADLTAALGAATAGGDREAAAGALLALVSADATLVSDYDGADRWATVADGALARLADPLPARRRLADRRALVAKLRVDPDDADRLYQQALALAEQLHDDGAIVDELDQLAQIEMTAGHYEDAAGRLDRALPLATRVFGAAHPRTLSLRHDQGNLEYYRGHFDRAASIYGDVLAARERTLGADSPEVALTLDALSIAEENTGKRSDALAHELRAVDITERHYGADHVETASALIGLGGAYHALGDHRHALEANLRALAIREKVLGPDHPDVGYSLVDAAIESKALGEMKDVEPRYRRAIAIFEKALGKDNPTTGIAHLNLAELLRVTGRLDDAAREYAIARDVLTRTFGAHHPVQAHVDNGLGQLALARGDLAAAAPLLEKAVAEREKSGDPPDLAESRFGLARAIAARDPPRARSLATQARDVWAGLGADYASQQADADAWLARTAPPR